MVLEVIGGGSSSHLLSDVNYGLTLNPDFNISDLPITPRYQDTEYLKIGRGADHYCF